MWYIMEGKVTYKGFNRNLTCRGFQYEVGKEYVQEGDIKCGDYGFHACTNPLDVLRYYDIDNNHRFCEVEQSGVIHTSYPPDSERVSSKIKITSEIGLTGLFKAGMEWIIKNTNAALIANRIKKNLYDRWNLHLDDDCTIVGLKHDNVYISATEDNAQIGVSGFFGRISSSGECARIVLYGYAHSVSSSGNCAYIGVMGHNIRVDSSGHHTKIYSESDSAMINSSGNYALVNSIGKHSVICCTGLGSSVKASLGSWITLADWAYSYEQQRHIPVFTRTEYVDGETIKADTWYRLVDGYFKAVDE